MGIINKFKSMFGSDPTIPEIVTRNAATGLYQVNISACLDAAARWKPSLTNYTFAEECAARLNYLSGSMQGDMNDVLKRRFPMTYRDIIREQVNVRLYQKIINDQAKTFMDSRYALVDENGEQAPPDDSSAIAFADMVTRGCFDIAFRDADRQIHALHRLAIVLRYDAIHKRVMPMIWPQHLVHWVPDPDLYYMPDAAFGVLLEVASDTGITDVESRRYEVWANIEVDGITTGIHYYTGQHGDKYYDRPVDGNEQRLNPYIDPRTGLPMYPIVWWQSDLVPSIYYMPDEDALTIPRMLNAALTDVNWGMHYGSHPIVSWEYQAGAEAAIPPPKAEVGPGRTLNVAGLHPRFTHPGYDPEPAMKLWSTLTDLESKIGGGVPVALMRDSGSPESGYALRIRNLPLEEHRNEMISIMRAQVEETLYRAAVCWNQYLPTKIDLEKYHPVWYPGDIAIPVDERESADIHASRIAANVENVIEWRMHITGENEQQATDAVRKNAEINASTAKSGAVDFPPIGKIDWEK